jgi:hypothetical protein
MDDTCPKCRKPLRLAVVKPHTTRPNLLVHSFECAHCGAEKPKSSCESRAKTPLEAPRSRLIVVGGMSIAISEQSLISRRPMVRGHKGRHGKTPERWDHAGFFYARIPHVREVFTGGASEAQHALHGSHSSGGETILGTQISEHQRCRGEVATA